MFQLKFNPTIIKHLGIKMYSTLPPVLSELITNSYDADATIVTITINNQDKYIEIIDDGCGMSAEELNNDFLNVGQNRREKYKTDETKKFKRKVTGKKGIGKLSVFGICTKIYVESCQNNKINSFEIDYDELMKQSNDKPLELKPIKDNKPSKSNSYTKVILRHLKRKTKIDIKQTSKSILMRLRIFDDSFTCILKNNQQEEKLTNQIRHTLIKEQFSWHLPNDFIALKVDDDTIRYFKNNNINGKIITTDDTIKEEDLKGITLYARGKLANSPEFYGAKLSNSHAFSYMSGYVNVDFIDDDWSEDCISTARNSLTWENEEAEELKNHLKHIIGKIGTQWKDKRREVKIKYYQEVFNIDTSWYETNIQSSSDKKLAKKITNIVLSSDLDGSKTKDLLDYVKGAFEFEIFKDYAHELEENADGEKLLKLLKDWEVIELKEQYRLAIGRVETIDKFKKLINADTKEVGGLDSMHSFLNKFPWILEPRISSFKDEVSYREILLNTYKEGSLDEKNRRIDFLCKSFNNTLYILEIKRSKKVIDKNDLIQLEDYCTFVRASLIGTGSDRDNTITKVIGYIIGKSLKDDNVVHVKLKGLANNDMFFLSYETMLNQAEEYHKDFIDSYEKVNKLLKSSNS